MEPSDDALPSSCGSDTQLLLYMSEQQEDMEEEEEEDRCSRSRASAWRFAPWRVC